MVIKVQLLFLILFFGPLVHFSFAAQSQSYIDKANALELSSDPFWRNILHFKGRRSQIIDKSFFLSERGRFDAQAELEATLNAYFGEGLPVFSEHKDQNIVCIYPARYTWLNEKLDLPDFHIDTQNCPILSEWTRLNEIDAISIFYVSGYLGNPASSFGHAILNMKTKGEEEMFTLLDTTVSYGATVPINENVVFYIFKGLFGGYYATFSDKYFFAHDQVYTNKESRDMWEYTLNLSEHDRTMMIYHMAELLTKKYRYFFLSSNCAQRLAVLLDIFIEEDVYDFNYPVYVPEELFQRLHTIDRQRRQNGQPALIDDIKYIPSARRHLYYEIERLSPQERQIYTTITDNPDDELTGYLEPLDVEGRINVLNALLAYQYYKWMAEDEANPDQTLKEYKRKILLERLQLPAKEVIPVSIPELPSPKTMPPPSSFNLGFVAETHSDPYATFGATVFRKESVGLNALEFNDLVALSLNIGMFADSDKIFVDTFDFLKIRDYRTFYIPEANEHPFSWRVRAGIDRYNNHNDADYDYLFDSGIGFVNKIKDKGIYYGFLNGGLHTLDQNYRAGPSAGFVIGNDKLKMQNDVGLEFDLENGEYIETFNTSMQYQINQRNALQATFEKTNRERFSLNYIYYW